MSQNSTKQQTQEHNNNADPINENIQTIVELHKRAENEASRQQRTIENITDFPGPSRFPIHHPGFCIALDYCQYPAHKIWFFQL